MKVDFPGLGFLLGGVTVGWTLATLLVHRDAATGMLALAIAGAGWIVSSAVQRAARTRSELDRIPIESVGKLCERIDGLVSECLGSSFKGPRDPDLVQRHRLLANELTWLTAVAQRLGLQSQQFVELSGLRISFKTLLTGGGEPQASRAAEVGRAIRIRCLQVRWQICQHILLRPDALAGLDESIGISTSEAVEQLEGRRARQNVRREHRR